MLEVRNGNVHCKKLISHLGERKGEVASLRDASDGNPKR